MSIFSYAGQTRIWPQGPFQPPVYARLSVGHAYAISVVNNSGTDITSGTIVIQDAQALENDFCVADDATWADVTEVPDCSEGAGVGGPATITFSPQYPLRAWSECQYAVPCVREFMRVQAPQANAVVNIISGRLKRVQYG